MFTAEDLNYDNSATIQRNGFTLTLSTEHDSHHGAPWDEEDGHGPVSEWTTRAKAPGELVLCEDNGSARFYDYVEACRIALRDGWGFAPAPMTALRNSGGRWHAFFGNGHGEGCNVGGYKTQSEAIKALYTAHRATFPSARAYAAAAARADYDRLRAWCNDDWHYVGVIVTASRNGITLGRASLWGIESDCSDYILDVANELAPDAISDARATLESLA